MAQLRQEAQQAGHQEGYNTPVQVSSAVIISSTSRTSRRRQHSSSGELRCDKKLNKQDIKKETTLQFR